MSLIQIKRNLKTRRMNQIPIYNICHLHSETTIEDISEIIKKQEITEIVQSVLHDMIDLIETNHNFEYVHLMKEPKKKNIFKKIASCAKKLIYKT